MNFSGFKRIVRLNGILIVKNQADSPVARDLLCISFRFRNGLPVLTKTDPVASRISRTDLTSINPGQDMISGSVGSSNGRDARGTLLVNSRASPTCVPGALRLERSLSRRGVLLCVAVFPRVRRARVFSRIHGQPKRSRRHSSSR